VAVRIGTSGWLYPHWRGLFYPERLPARERLAWLARSFDTVEINGTFYSMQRPSSFQRWRDAVPSGFVFAVKGSRFLTHNLKLRRPRPALGNFFAQGLLLLGAELGPVLWQLPPFLHFHADVARAFFEELPHSVADAERVARHHDQRVAGRSVLAAPDGRSHRLRHALEVRHESWLADEALELLIEHGIALVHADTAGQYPFSLVRTADFAYVRLHGAEGLYSSSYRAAELAYWTQQIEGWADEGSDVYVYFDNDFRAYAPENALALKRLLGRDADRRPAAGHEPAAPL
jgi:uncharacterized protein YecE (DUF72 family)